MQTFTDRSLSVATRLITFAMFIAALFSPGRTSAQTNGVASIRHVWIMPSKGPVEIQIEGSDRLAPEPQILSGPDRLVVDFPNSIPGPLLHSQAINDGDVKDVRVSLFSSKPPVTRVVFDLKGPDSYQVVPSGRNVVVKVGGGIEEVQGSPKPRGLVNASFSVQGVKVTPPPAAPPPPQKVPLRVTFQNGLLTIHSDKASLSEILFAVHQRTGADIGIPAGAEQEKVAAQIGPGSAPEVLAQLLNGSSFNFLILSAADNPRNLDRVILTPRGETATNAPLTPIPAQQPMQEDDTTVDEAPPQPQPTAESPQPGAPSQQAPGRMIPTTPPDNKPAENNDSPD
jgi:hypothetical protein